MNPDTPASSPAYGLISRIQGGLSYLLPLRDKESLTVNGGEEICFLPKTLRRRARAEQTSTLAVGDRVRWERADDRARIMEVLPRGRVLSRHNLQDHRTQEDVLAANPDRLLAVVSLHEPEFNPGLLDRLLCAAERDRLPAVVIVNKIDLAPDPAGLEERMIPWRQAGYRYLAASAREGTGVAELRTLLGAGISLLAGKSGVGKSSLLNAVQPGLRLRTGEVSARGGAGRHTTTCAELLPYRGGFIVDTPGLRELGLWGVTPAELGELFPEFRPYLGNCRFRNCLHDSEPDCAVKAAAETGAIHPRRLADYLSLLAELHRLPTAEQG